MACACTTSRAEIFKEGRWEAEGLHYADGAQTERLVKNQVTHQRENSLILVYLMSIKR